MVYGMIYKNLLGKINNIISYNEIVYYGQTWIH